MRRLFKWFLILLVLAVIGGGVSYPFVSKYFKPPPKYRTAAVSKGRVETVVNSTGTVKPVKSVTVGAFVSGPIAEIYVDFNSQVKKGDLMAKIDPRLLRAAVDRDQATLATQKAELARIDALLQQAKNNEGRARRLQAVNKDYLSDVEMDQYHFTRMSLDAQRSLAEAGISQAEANLKNTQTNLGYTEIRSPVDGIVIERKVDVGQTVAASFQTPELFIVAPEMDRQMHVFATVDEADIGLIRAAQEKGRVVEFTVDAYPDELFPGKIFQVRKNGTTNQNVVTYPVVIEAVNSRLKLMPGMTANLTFLIEAKENVMRVPVAALRFYPVAAQIHPDDRHFLDSVPANGGDSAIRMTAQEKSSAAHKRQKRVVWVQEGDKLRGVSVVLGIMDNQNAELVSGDLTEGQELVTGVDDTAAK